MKALKFTHGSKICQINSHLFSGEEKKKENYTLFTNEIISFKWDFCQGG
jgi:hypothetical protein